MNPIVNKKLIFSALVAGAALTSTSLSAQVSKNAGLLLNVHAQATGLAVEDEDAETGFGGGIIAGYGFNENLSVYLALDGASVSYSDDDADGEKYTLAQADLGLRYTFGSTASALRPYLNGAISGVGVSDEFEDEDSGESVDVSYTGPGVTFGAGVQYFFNPKLAIDGSIQVSAGKLTTFKIDGEEFGGEDDDDPSFTTSRLQIGLSWHP
jgi:opacity protein-like surface antigen